SSPSVLPLPDLHSSATAELSAAPLVTATTVVTITTGGFVPTVLTTTTSTQVVWLNATSQTQVLQSGTPSHVYLPLITRGGGSATGSVSQTSVAPSAALAASGLFSATIPPGGTFAYTFAAPGTYAYFLVTAMQFSGRAVVQQA